MYSPPSLHTSTFPLPSIPHNTPPFLPSISDTIPLSAPYPPSLKTSIHPLAYLPFVVPLSVYPSQSILPTTFTSYPPFIYTLYTSVHRPVPSIRRMTPLYSRYYPFFLSLSIFPYRSSFIPPLTLHSSFNTSFWTLPSNLRTTIYFSSTTCTSPTTTTIRLIYLASLRSS